MWRVPSRLLGAVLWVGATSMVPMSVAADPSKGQCKKEIRQLCAGVERGPALLECVVNNIERLSPACQARLRAWQVKHVQKTAGTKARAAQ